MKFMLMYLIPMPPRDNTKIYYVIKILLILDFLSSQRNFVVSSITYFTSVFVQWLHKTLSQILQTKSAVSLAKPM